MNTNKYLKAFVAGSSFPVIITPYLYIGVPLHFNSSADVTYLFDVLLVPLMIGVINIIFIATRDTQTSPTKRYWLFGAANGLFFSLLGTLVTNIPTDLFGLTEITKFAMIPVAMLLYSLIWRYVVRNINIMMSLESN